MDTASLEPGKVPKRAVRRDRIRIAVLLLAALGLWAFVARAELFRAVVAAVVDVVTGDRVSFEALEVGSAHTRLLGLHVRRGGDPLLDVERADLSYDLGQLVAGRTRRFGLESIRLVRPRLTLVRRADGSFNLGASGGGAGGAAGPAGTPLRFRAEVQAGSVLVLDPFRTLPNARRLGLERLAGSLDYNDASRTAYRFSGLVGGDPAQRVLLAGRIDAAGFAVHHLTAADVDLAPIADYFINTASARVLRGRLRAVDLRAYAFPPAPGAAGGYHLSGSGELTQAAMAVPGLTAPATDMRGRLDLVDDGLVAPSLLARLGPLDVRLAGGLYGWHAPALRLGLRAASAPLDRIRGLFTFSTHLPLTGQARLATLVEGPVGRLIVATRVTVPALRYGAYPVERVAGRAVYYGGAVDVLGASGTYGPLAVRATGAIALGGPVVTQLVVDAAGAANGVPYAAQIAPGAGLHVAALLAGENLRFDARGTLDGAGAGTTVAGVFHLDPNGDGTFGPLDVRRDDGTTLAGTYYSERSASRSGFWLDARGFALTLAPADPHLPGVGLAPPAFSGRFDGAVAGEGPPSRFRLAARLRGNGVRVGDVAFDTLGGHAQGSFSDLRLAGVKADGPWGTFAGGGAYAGSRLALTGAYHGSFGQLRTFTGDLGASGPVDGPVALLIDPRRTVIQARDDSTLGARVRRVPVDGLAGTLSVENDRLRIFAATAGVAGATLAAAGTLQGPEGIGVSVAGADGRRLRDLVAVGSGNVSAIGSLDASGRETRFRGGLALGRGTVGNLAVSGNGEVALAGNRLDVGRTDAVVGAALGSLTGSVAELGTPRTRYDLDLHVASARVAPFALAFDPRRRDLAGTLSGDLHVSGEPSRLIVDGRVAVPEGTVNGLAFSDASAGVRLAPGGLLLRRGRVTVGTTQSRFAFLYGPGEAALRVDAPHADLADFNDYFDEGDALGGRGRILVRFVQRKGRRLTTSGDIAIASLRYRRFELGGATAAWTSRGPDVTGAIAFGGPSGRLQASGTVSLPVNAPPAKLVERSRFRGDAHLRDLDLGVWLPVVGYKVPVLGRVDADATVSGPLGNPLISTEATVAGGSFGRFPVDRLTVSAISTFHSTTVKHAELELPALSVEGSGTFGLGAHDPLAFALHAKSPDVGAFADRLLGSSYPVSGRAEADVHVAGTRAVPKIAGGVDVENMVVRGVAVPLALGQFSVTGRDVVLSGVEVGFATGALYLAGSVPLEVAPFSFGPAAAPIALDVSVKGVDLADFTTLLPADSQLAGKLDGRIGISGTAGAPQLDGALALSGGSLRTPLEVVPLTGLAARLTFDGDVAKLESFHGAAGGGTLEATGRATLPTLVHPSTDAVYRLDARAANLHLDLPAFGSGTVDGTLTVAHDPATPPVVSGKLALSDATIPFSALLLADSGGGGFDTTAPTVAALPVDQDIALALDVSADRNVRVRSANVDIGARGDLAIAGSRASPQLTGVFTSTGGTLTYFNTVFRLVDGTVTFEPDLGVIPTLAARAVTHVINPDPNTVRNNTGTADITLNVAGPVTNLTIGLTSTPSYERQQILGLLLDAPALGAKNLFGDTPGTPTLLGSNATGSLAAGVAANRNVSGELSVAQEAFGVANAQFTRTLLAPFESTVASAVGLTNLNVNVDYTGNVGVTARKILGKNVDAIYGTTFGYPYRQTFGFDVKGGDATAGQVTVFQTLGASGLNSLSPNTYFYTTNPKLQATQPTAGTAGFSLSLQRLFW
jgi:hypothetical protein